MINRQIVISGLVLMAAGAYRVFLMTPKTDRANVTLTRVLVGGYVLVILASVLDLVGGPAPAIAGGIMSLAVLTALYAVLPDLFQRITARKGA